MTTVEYEKQFEAILEGENTTYPYDSDDYKNYVKLNAARIKRWKKTAKMSPALIDTISKIKQTTNWILITEPWCGDAAHSHVFIVKMAELNSKINLIFQNRDAPNSEIEKYLTNGGKSIPKLIVRDQEGNDLFTWGPRPKEAQDMLITQDTDTNLSLEDKKKILQKWYNKDKGASIQLELNDLIQENM